MPCVILLANRRIDWLSVQDEWKSDEWRRNEHRHD